MFASAGESARGAVGDAGAAVGLLETAIAHSWLLAAFVRLASSGALERAGGTPLPAAEALRILEGAGFVGGQQLPSPPGAPALYASRRPEVTPLS